MTPEQVAQARGCTCAKPGETDRACIAHGDNPTVCARCLGSAVVESAWVAAGCVDAYQMLKVNAWDIAAGALIVARAGGRVSALDGARWHPGLKNAVVSNGLIHDLLLRNP